jgi:hypothetical protein
MWSVFFISPSAFSLLRLFFEFFLVGFSNYSHSSCVSFKVFFLNIIHSFHSFFTTPYFQEIGDFNDGRNGRAVLKCGDPFSIYAGTTLLKYTCLMFKRILDF